MHDEPEIDLADLLEKARAGDEAAANQIVTRFEPELRTLIRARLPQKLRKVFDSGDALQEVWRSFLCPKRGAENAVVPASDQIRAYLMTMVKNRVSEEHRKFTQTRKYDLGLERPLIHTLGDKTTPVDLPSQDPTPSQICMADEALKGMLKGQPSKEQFMLERRHLGWTHGEIADAIGQTERTVRRFFEKLQHRMIGRPTRKVSGR